MNMTHQVSEGATVMNAREERWIRDELQGGLPVAGPFIVEDDVMTRWMDHWNLPAFRPMIDAVAA